MGIERADVICPFYKYDDGFARIVCEGVDDECSLVTQYMKRVNFTSRLKKYCYKSCQECEIFRMLMENKYPDVFSD